VDEERHAQIVGEHGGAVAQRAAPAGARDTRLKERLRAERGADPVGRGQAGEAGVEAPPRTGRRGERGPRRDDDDATGGAPAARRRRRIGREREVAALGRGRDRDTAAEQRRHLRGGERAEARDQPLGREHDERVAGVEIEHEVRTLGRQERDRVGPRRAGALGVPVAAAQQQHRDRRCREERESEDEQRRAAAKHHRANDGGVAGFTLVCDIARASSAGW
jgi:hypothetical protein